MTNFTDTCTHCGAEFGLHQYGTHLCPVGGREAKIGHTQEWQATTFEQAQSDDDELGKLIRELHSKIARLDALINQHTA
jgi:hypothetical protein